MQPSLDFPFTEQDVPKAREVIERDLRAVCDAVARADPRLDALVLTGGFSRGEGTVRDGRPVNDYDLVAIRRGAGGDALYRGLGHRLSRDVGIEVDLLPVARARLPHVGRKLFWLDARLGGRVIWGDADALRRLPAFAPADLPPLEPARLLGNRAAGLLLALPTPDDPQPPEQCDLQATKAALAAMDATLLARGRYAPRMRERLALLHGHPDHATFARAVAWKLAGAWEPLGAPWWREARDALLRAVDATRARHADDGLAEHAMHLLRARRPALHPSRAIRREAWDLLARSDYPAGPAGGWDKKDFFARRGRTLQ